MNPNEATWSGPHRLRTSDTERERVATILRAAMTEGRLSLAEGEERMAAAYAATYRDELAPLTADLPDQGRQALQQTPEAVAESRRDLRRHAGFVVVVSLLLVGAWLLSHAPFFWPIFPLIFLFAGLRRHARHGRHPQWHHQRHRVAPWNAPDYR
ncbi:DUF1707 SHOCT-like domain-containing protein [Mangrovihabitans endophyticus]|uniref:DUF1707 domain-containing protein n=1 Tax=Mangrovihabitans endophyticus TaxID=1751298 RepID=A0A8J3BVB5_9ACTN|nr:DUF1707 domain-containing protein [Mangrovihabitans endophyticus]GGK72061.1 hypothetical protein GCM10012284_02320 [Mangrovihabitans endophyticus]